MTAAVCCSWSGGKDSCLALDRAIRGGARPVCLATMFTEDGQRSRSHGLSRAVIEAQAASLGLPVVSRSATWDDYESAMIDLLAEAKSRGASAAVFGDIDIPRHRLWEEMVSRRAGLAAVLPLWQEDRQALLAEWWERGFTARIAVVREGLLDRSFLGCVLDQAVANGVVEAGVDACGENGEVHTVVVDGPLFRWPIPLRLGEQSLRSGCWFQDMSL